MTAVRQAPPPAVNPRAYPRVVDEVTTLRQVLAGHSIARYGDGEFSMACGGAMKSQAYDEGLSRRLREILLDSGPCLVGIPNIHPDIDTPKRSGWDKQIARGIRLTDPTRTYHSAFITRPDSAPWIDTLEYWDLVEQVWRDQDVVLVRGSEKSLLPSDLTGARSVREVKTRPQHAWQDYAAILAAVDPRPETRVLLCIGATATVMAVDLCARGVHAIDLGHLGMFLRKHRRGDPMWVTAEDKEPPRG